MNPPSSESLGVDRRLWPFRWGKLFSRLVGRAPGFTQDEMRTLARVLHQRVGEAEAAAPLSGEAVHKAFFLPVFETQAKRFESKAQPHP